ncbi:tyrosine-type recombinase/integrase [Mesorhizobium sp. WSM3876]|uniref:tyrosine-type recombinase/integrase n=1 Tax=Mesorhizobium sp. WSM3876 TaxID=422277 RepID=UPI000BAE93C0|nr:tyrosine-type recombinase/integrase [Mesorhizobium sp. WSM3876]PBB88011.1 integrase [Mesorhizobium sp. WSM3876]
MGLVLKHVYLTKAGTWHYRRRLPRDVTALVGQNEFKRYLGSTEREALRNYPKVNSEFERLVSEARRRRDMPADTLRTPLDVHRLAERRAAELATTTVHVGGRMLPGSEPEAADLIRDSYLSRFSQDEAGDPVGVPEVEGRALAILASGGNLSRPAPTIEDARKLYMRERVEGDINEAAKTARLNRVLEYMKAAGVGKDRTLVSLTREDARDVRDYLVRDEGMKAATVRRYMNDIRALINLGMTELGLKDAMSNPFLNLTIKGAEAAATPAVDERKPIPEAMMGPLRERIVVHAGEDLSRIWRIAEGTGCRLGEVTGLLVADVVLDGTIPYLNLVPHAHRRLKTAASARRVPLIGDALAAAKEAVEAAGDGSILFARYGRARGSDAASAALMKHVRVITDDPKIVVHSLRHSVEDRLMLAKVDEFDRKLILGHSSGGMTGRYGGPDARLKVAERGLKAALGVAGKRR